jgi:peptidyl-prolyl cis-trans isomerase SurA
VVFARGLIYAVLIGATTTAVAESRQRVTVDRVVAIVNDAVILGSEVELRIEPVRAQVAQLPDARERDRRLAQLSRQTLDSMIDDALILQAGIAAGITVDSVDVDAAIELLKQDHGLNDQQLAEAMRQQGMSRDTLRDDVLRQRAVNQLVAPKVQVGDADVTRRYAEMQRRSALVTAVDVSQIVFALGEHPTEQELAAARSAAERALARIRAGEDFAVVAAAASQDRTTANTGGRLGWLEAGTLTPDWEPIVLAMDKGEVRGPIRLGSGIYLLHANDVRRTQLQPLTELKPQILSELRRKALAKQTQLWVEELRKKAHIDIKL